MDDIGDLLERTLGTDGWRTGRSPRGGSATWRHLSVCLERDGDGDGSWHARLEEDDPKITVVAHRASDPKSALEPVAAHARRVRTFCDGIGLVQNPSRSWLSHRIWHAVRQQSEGAEVGNLPAEPTAETPHALLRIVGATALFLLGGALAYWVAQAALGGSEFGGHGFTEAYALALFGLTSCVLVYRALCVAALADEGASAGARSRRCALREVALWGLAGLWMPAVVLATAGSAVWVPVLVVLAGAVVTDVVTTRVNRSPAALG